MFSNGHPYLGVGKDINDVTRIIDMEDDTPIQSLKSIPKWITPIIANILGDASYANIIKFIIDHNNQDLNTIVQQFNSKVNSQSLSSQDKSVLN